jgi:fermentation-respiration switch protein FrsA (DUF1100 family)
MPTDTDVQAESAPSPAKAAKPSVLRRIFGSPKRLLIDVAAFYAVLLCYLYLAQVPLIFPGSMRHGSAETHIKTAPGVELITLRTAGGETVKAIFGKALTEKGAPDPDAAHRPTLLFFYGNTDTVSDCAVQLELFRRLGANVMIPEFVGYGASTGVASETGCYATADAAYDYLASCPGIDPRRIYVGGASLGAASAVDLATRKPVAGLATFMAFTSMAEMGSHQYPIVPTPIVRLLLKHRFLNESKMPRVHCPILIAHGRADRFVSYDMADRLAKAAGGPVTRIGIPGAGHGDLFAIGWKQIAPVMREFLGNKK